MAPKKTKDANPVRVLVAKQRDTKHRETVVVKRSKTKRPDLGRPAVDRNDYLDSLLNPRLAKHRNIGVPSGNLPSTTFQTKRIITVAVDPIGGASYCFMPSLKNGVLRLGSNPNGAVTTMSASTGTDLSFNSFTAAGYSPATISTIVSVADHNDILVSASAIRPVSMQVDWIPMGAALVEAGAVNVRMCDRSDLPGSPDTPASGVSGEVLFGIGPSTAALIQSDDRSSEVRATETISAMWSPEDEQDLIYRPVLPADTTGGTAESGDSVLRGFVDAQWVSTSGATPTDTAYLPYEAVRTSPSLAAGSDYRDGLFRGYPYIQFTFASCQATAAATTTIGELVVYTNWEMITDGSRVIDMTTPRVSNPLELAQAGNVTAMVPMITVPSQPANPLTLIHEAAETATDHLYVRNAPTKQAIEGTSWLPNLVKAAAPAAGLIAGAIPGIGAVAGPLVSAGASLLASLLG